VKIYGDTIFVSILIVILSLATFLAAIHEYPKVKMHKVLKNANMNTSQKALEKINQSCEEHLKTVNMLNSIDTKADCLKKDIKDALNKYSVL